MPKIDKNLPSKLKKVKIKKSKPLKVKTALAKPRTPISKEKTCAYYDCLIQLISSPANDRAKITELTRKCKCSKEEMAKAKTELKHQLVHELAQDYKKIGINLGKYVQADIVGCVKELK